MRITYDSAKPKHCCQMASMASYWPDRPSVWKIQSKAGEYSDRYWAGSVWKTTSSFWIEGLYSWKDNPLCQPSDRYGTRGINIMKPDDTTRASRGRSLPWRIDLWRISRVQRASSSTGRKRLLEDRLRPGWPSTNGSGFPWNPFAMINAKL